MSAFELFPRRRLRKDYPGWIWFSGIASITGSIVAGTMMLYLISVGFQLGAILYYFAVSIALPIFGHGILNGRAWAKHGLMVVAASIVLVTGLSGIHKIAFVDIRAVSSSSRGILEMALVYGWLLVNAYIVYRLLLERGDSLRGAAPVEAEARSGSRWGVLYYVIFLVLWYGLLVAALMGHMGMISLPLWSAGG